MVWARKWICVALAAGLLVSVFAATAGASHGGSASHVKSARTVVYRKVFLDEDEAPWAVGYMAKMKARGLMQGYPGGKFLPNAAVSRVEVVVLAVRLKGLEQEARDRTGAVLPFTDAEQIYRKHAWAVGYLAAAVGEGLIPASGAFQPEKAATRLWTAEVMIKAMGLEEEAEDAMDEDLPYSDADEIPDDKVGYVAVALERGIMTGYGNAFRPNAAIKRSEIAAVLDRADEALPPRLGHEVRGVISEVDEDDLEITVRTYNNQWWGWQVAFRRSYTGNLYTGTVTIPVSEEALILVDKNPAEFSDLEAGQRVLVLRNDDGNAILVDAHGGGGWLPSWPGTDTTTKEGVVTDITTGSTRKIEIEDSKGVETEYTLASSCRIYDEDGDRIDLDDVDEGDRVTLTITDSKVTKIEVEEAVDETVKTGEVTDVDLGTSRSVTIEDGDGVEREYAIASGCEFFDEDGDRVDLDDVEVGDEVRLTIVDSKVTKLEIEEPAADSVKTGEVTDIRPGYNPPRITIRLSGGSTFTAAISGSVVVREDGSSRDLDDVRVGDEVRIELRDGYVVRIEILDSETREYDGVVQNVYSSGSTRKMTIKLSSGGTTTFDLSDDVVVRYDGEAADVDDIQVGDTVEITVVDSEITRVEIEERSTTSREGSVTQVETGSSPRIWIRVSGGSVVNYPVASGATVVFEEDDDLDLEDVVPGDDVELTISNSKVTRIVIEERQEWEVHGTITGLDENSTSRDRITVRDSAGNNLTYAVWDDATIKRGSTTLEFDDLDEGDVVELTIEGNFVTAIVVLDD